MSAPRPGALTGGQYSLVRVALGAYLFVHFCQLVPWGAELFSDRGVLADATSSPPCGAFPNLLCVWDAPAVVTVLLVSAALLSVLLAAGGHDRPAAVGLWYLLACLFGRNPLIANPSLPFVGWMLLAHAFVPGAPYGSWAARGRGDPAGPWRMPSAIHGAAWVLLSLGYSYSGWTKLVSPSWLDGTALRRVLENPLARPGFVRDVMLELPEGVLQVATWGGLALELAFAPLALFSRLRPWLWTLLLGMHVSLILIVDFADLSLGMIVFHLFTFDARWVRGLPARARETLFYDGTCGLCHRFVRFVLAEDSEGEAFRLSPLGGEAFRVAVPAATAAALADSMVVRTADGRLLQRSAAVLHVMGRLGGAWRVLGAVLRLVPSRVRDAAYDAVASVRHRLFTRPTTACPLVPPHLLGRFEP